MLNSVYSLTKDFYTLFLKNKGYRATS